MKTKIYFVGVDNFNRATFKAVDKNEYYCTINSLFSEDATELQVLLACHDRPWVDICYKGKHFNSEPDGAPCDIEIIPSKKMKSKLVVKYYEIITGNKITTYNNAYHAAYKALCEYIKAKFGVGTAIYFDDEDMPTIDGVSITSGDYSTIKAMRVSEHDDARELFIEVCVDGYEDYNLDEWVDPGVIGGYWDLETWFGYIVEAKAGQITNHDN